MSTANNTTRHIANYHRRMERAQAEEKARVEREATEDAALKARRIAQVTAVTKRGARYDRDVLIVEVSSQTDARITYKVHALGNQASCNCRGWSSHHHCKHADAVLNLLKEPLS